ncbi:MAG: hypothetical protein QOF07_2785, partial [Bradyrhizobium sp.]|nr:hypothetical protein [Bradyrhizobium sp.]
LLLFQHSPGQFRSARGYFRMMAHTHLMTPPLVFNDPEREVFNHKPSF